MTVKELKEIAKEKGLKGFSKLRKAELEELLREPTIQEKFIESLPEEVEVITYKDQDQWVETRKLGIGGSDVAAVLGQSKYKSAAEVYETKVNSVKFQGNRYTYFGHKLEPIVAECFQEKHNEYEVVEFEKTLKRGFSLANIDRLLVNKETGEYGVLECKTTSAHNYKEWEEDTVPQEYYCQVQHYLAVTGLKFAYICCVIGGNDFREFAIERNEEECQLLLEKCENFWKEHVEKRVPPKADGTSAYERHQKELAEKIESDDVLDLSDDETAISTMEELKELEKKYSELEKEIKLKKQQLFDKVMAQGCKKAVIQGAKINWITKTTTTLDKKRLAEVVDLKEYEIKKESGYFTIKK